MEQLEKYFDTAFGAPDGVKKLRELILTQALQGKLISQDPSEGTASELLKEILKEKKISINNTTSSNGNSANANPTEDPFNIPKSWIWSRLGDISIKIHYGYTASADFLKKHVKLLRITDIQDNKVNWDTVPGCNAKKDDLLQYLLNNNDILIARTGGTVGKSFLVQYLNVDSVFASYLIRVIPSKHIDVQYLKYFLESPLYWKQLLAACSGTGQPNVNGTSLYNLRLPIPLRKEQQRIIKRIEQLNSRCNMLEKLRAERDQKRLDVHTAAIRKLLDAPDQVTFDEAWQFITRHFGDLYTVRENVAELRKAILQLAVMGKLVPQDPKEGTARELLEEIEREKRKHSLKGKVKANITSYESSSYTIPFSIPSQWKWVRLSEIMLKITDGTHHSPPNSDKGDFLYISAKNIKDEGILVSNATYVSRAIHNEIYSRCDPEPGNILYIKDGATTGIVTINNLTEPFSLLSSVALLKQPKQINNRFLLYALRSPFFYDQMRSAMSGVAITRVTLKILNEALLPLPSLAEQNRIVNKVDHLLSICNYLVSQIQKAGKKQQEVLGAVMGDVGY